MTAVLISWPFLALADPQTPFHYFYLGNEFSSQADDLSGPGLLSAQCTIRVSNIRNGIRRVTFRNERDNKDQPMAIVLVDIQVLTLEEINERIAKCKRDIQVHFTKATHLILF